MRMDNMFRSSSLFIIVNLLLLTQAKPLVNGNYKDFCDQKFLEDSDIVQRGYRLLIPSSYTLSSFNQTSVQPIESTKYLLIKDVHNFSDCVKQCCSNEFKCDVAFFNHSSNVCLHVICNLDGSKAQCPLVRKDEKQQTSIVKIRLPKTKEPIKYRNELTREQLISDYGLVEETSSLLLKGKHFNKDQSTGGQSNGESLDKLTVIVDKNPIIRLPNNSITINAFVHPPSTHYVYKWTLVSRPAQNQQADSGSREEQNTDSLKLNKLIEGTYIFNVTVTSSDNPNAIGQQSVNITVLPPKRINQPPQAIVKPNKSTVQLPKQEIVLDGSQSIDDDKILSYKWELIKTPIGFELPSNDLQTQTLQLKNLIAGNYTFKLTVTDSDNQTSSAEADLTVLKEKDYQPTAVVSQDQILILPQNSVTLMGNGSTDDKKIVSYEWTLVDESGANKQINNVDMSGVKTPFLHLSNLEVGVYKAVLKVTDSSNQTSTAETHVFVKPEIDIKPEAIIKPEEQKVYMPLKENVTFDGSNSKDVSKGGIVKWKWSQVDGPRPSNIASPNNSTTIVTNLVPGQYSFLLELTNSKNLSSNATTKIEVFQNENELPVADAGGNQTFDNAKKIMILNGSRSHDDLIDLKYSWTREGNSLAVGDVVDQTDKTSVLQLINLIPGRYIFKLTVEDSQNAKASDIAVIEVKNAANIQDFVELLLNVNYKQFRYEQEQALIKKIEILLSSNIDETVKLTDVQVYPIYDTELVMLRFVVQTIVNGKKPMNLSATEAVKRFRLRLRNDKSLIDPEILKVRTTICQNSCSGHGKCVERTKECYCDSFWMQNFLRFHFGDGLENCDWSVLYVLIFSAFASVFVCTALWSFLCFFVRRRTLHRLKAIRLRRVDLLKKTRKSRSQKYTLLKQMNGISKGGDHHTSDESDSEIEHRNKLKKNNNSRIESKIKIKNGSSKSNYKDSSSESEVIEYDFSNISRRGYS